MGVVTLHAAAAACVLRHATSVPDARLLLEALGVVAPGGHVILPDPPPATLRTEDVKVPTAADPWSSPRAQAAAHARPANCTTPPGLRDLPPIAPSVPVAARKPRPRTARPAPPPTETDRLIAAGVNPHTAAILGAAS